MTAEKLALRTLSDAHKEIFQKVLRDDNLNTWELGQAFKFYKFHLMCLSKNGRLGVTKLGRWVVDNGFFSWVTDEHVKIMRKPRLATDDCQTDSIYESGSFLDQYGYISSFMDDDSGCMRSIIEHKGHLLLALLDGDFGDLNPDPEV